MIEVEWGKPIWSFGVMTGTSMDGVDIALLKTDGEEIFEFGPSESGPVFGPCQSALKIALEKIKEVPTEKLRCRKTWPDWLQTSEDHVRHSIHFTAETLLFSNGINMDGPTEEPWLWIDENWGQTCSGVHGQTIVHRPDEHFTLQIGTSLLSKPASLGISVTTRSDDPEATPASYFNKQSVQVTDFRSDDMKAGGQGAPLAPFYHFALAKHIGATEPVVFLNIGGVANITWVDPRKELPEEPGALMAFDTGPGNALVNDWMFQNTNCLVMDVDGATASTGRIHRDRLKTNWGKDYLRKPGPKSLDRNDFHGVLAAMQGLSINDGAATLTAFTADCVGESLRHMPSPPTRWLVCGGGRHNRTMMQMLQARLDAPVEPVEAVGLDGDMLEAQAFAYLAVRVLRGLPTSAPSTTGCREPVCGGRISYP